MKFPEAEKSVSPEGDANKSCTTDSVPVVGPLPAGGPNVLMHLARWRRMSHN